MTNKRKKYAGKLDKIQQALYSHFSKDSYLSVPDHIATIIDWVTFYRRNFHRFAIHYLNLRPHLFQAYLLQRMSQSVEAIIIAARTASKSFTIAIYSVCKAILYPNSQIVIASATKRQAELIVTEKIEKELIPNSPNLQKEIRRISSNHQATTVEFYNGSSITVVVASDNARGHRSTVMIYEEARMIDKGIIDSVLSQFQHVRVAPYKDLPQYKNLPLEESSSIFISSAWYRSHWMYEMLLKTAKLVASGDDTAFVCAFDYCITLYHKIKTRRQFIELRRRLDPATWSIECENMMIGENEHAFFTYDMFVDNQNIKRAMYPRHAIDMASKKKNPYCLPHQEGEIRLVSCDIAFVDKQGNDNSIYSVIRLLPESLGKDGGSTYRKQVCYMESIHGGDTEAQALRIKQIYYDLECDYCILDTRNGGISLYDMLARVMWDEDAQCEYPAWRAINDDNIAGRIKVESAIDVVYAINASAKLNSDIAMLTRAELMNKRVDILISHERALDEILPNIKEYVTAVDLDEQLFFEKPYLEMQAFINECIELVYEKSADTGMVKVHEQGTKTKDRYTSVSYGLYFASLVEHEAVSATGDYYSSAFCN